MRAGRALIGAAILIPAAPALAAGSADFDIPAGTLEEALLKFGAQARVNIGLSDPVLAGRQVWGVHGHMPIALALRLLLRNTGARFAFVDPVTIRISLEKVRPPVAAKPAPRMAPDADNLIIVSASKLDTAAALFPGTIDIVEESGEQGASAASRGTEAIIERLPMLASTGLGAGRDKLFIRGVADSSFAEGSQATVGLYLGEARLSYNAPDPDLLHYDLKRTEVIEGPQGTLYGNGAIGGIIRLVANPPDTGHSAGWIGLGGGATQSGAPSRDVAAMVNLPLGTNGLALRGLAYSTLDGGYIDDPSRGLANINQTRTDGGRLVLRWHGDGPWALDLGGVVQNITARDSQYIVQGTAALSRRSPIAQPFDNDYRLGFATLAREGQTTSLTSTWSFVRHSLTTTYDATGYGGNSAVQSFREARDITLVANETRLTDRDHRWLIGVSGLYNEDLVTRALCPPDAAQPISGTRNQVGELALFGQWIVPVGQRLQLTLGNRLTLTRVVGALVSGAGGENAEPSQTSFRASPSLALGWRARDQMLVFARIAQGNRAGGLSVAPAGATVSSQHFDGDSLLSGELGVRLGHTGGADGWLSASGFYTHWSGIQADLLDRAGLPYTTNIGEGRIYGVEAQGGFSPLPGVLLSGAGFVNSSKLTSALRGPTGDQQRELPNIAHLGGQIAASYQIALRHAASLTLNASLHYVGRSYLGIGPLFDVPQGDYWTGAAGAHLAWRRFVLSVDISNLFNGRGNRFAFGNPFGILAENQITPLRPRTVRVGLEAEF